MKWFLVAFIVYVENNQMDMKLNTVLKFNNLERCEIYVKEFKPILEQRVTKVFSRNERIIFTLRVWKRSWKRCVKKC